jgi:hypothetical protein
LTRRPSIADSKSIRGPAAFGATTTRPSIAIWWSSTSISCYRSERSKYWGRSSPRPRLGCALDRDLPPGPREPHRHQRASVTQGQMPDLGSVDGGDFYFSMRSMLRRGTQAPGDCAGADPEALRARPEPMSRCSALNRGGPRHARSLPSCRMRLTPPGQIRIERFGWTFCRGRQGYVGRERLRQRGLQR